MKLLVSIPLILRHYRSTIISEIRLNINVSIQAHMKLYLKLSKYTVVWQCIY